VDEIARMNCCQSRVSVFAWSGAFLEKAFINQFFSVFYVTLSYTQQQVQQSKGVARDRASHLPTSTHVTLTNAVPVI
jgi:hypothetical protein